MILILWCLVPYNPRSLGTAEQGIITQRTGNFISLIRTFPAQTR